MLSFGPPAWQGALPMRGGSGELGRQVVAIHGGLDQEERHEAIRSFKEGSKARAGRGLILWFPFCFLASFQ